MTYATRDDLETLTTLVGATARAAESASHTAERVCDRVDDLAVKLDSYIFESQRLLTRDGERITIQEGQSERLEAIAASLTRSNEHTQQLIQIQQQRMELQQQQLDLQRQRLDTQDETLRSINAAVERLEAIVTRMMD
jgi:small-conductance mechanosensitive channel